MTFKDEFTKLEQDVDQLIEDNRCLREQMRLILGVAGDDHNSRCEAAGISDSLENRLNTIAFLSADSLNLCRQCQVPLEIVCGCDCNG